MINTFTQFIKEFRWFTGMLVLLLLTLSLFYGILPGLWFYETVFKPYIFPNVRLFLDHTFGLLPFNSLFFMLSIAIGIAFYQIVLIWRNRKGRGTYIKYGLRILLIPIVLFNLFYWFWGFHYLGESLGEQMGLKSVPINEKRLSEEFKSTLQSLAEIRKEIGLDSTQSYIEYSILNLPTDTVILESGTVVFNEFGLDLYGEPRIKMLYPKGFLHRLNTSGFYNPISGECTIEADLHPLQIPFIKAHEWTHAQGITDEGDANFLAYWITVNSSNLTYQYSGHITYWRYLLSEARRRYPDLYASVTSDTPTGVKKDLIEIRESNNKYPEFMPRTRDLVYESYLKSHGISDGMDSYNRFVAMVVSYKREMKI